MEIFNRNNTRNTGSLKILASHMLISPQNSSTRSLSIQVFTKEYEDSLRPSGPVCIGTDS